MRIVVVTAAWVMGSLLFGLVAGQLFRFFGERDRVEEESISLFEKNLSSAPGAVSHTAGGDPGLKVA